MNFDLDALMALLPADRFDRTPAVLAAHGHGESFGGDVLPDVVVFPRSTDEVAQVVRFANASGTPVTPVGANSSLEGHTVPLHGGISLDMARMDAIVEVLPEDGLAVVQPAVTYPRLNDVLRPTGWFFPVDPGAPASLGGMASTNASGTMAVRYGTTRERVQALEVVTASGQVIRTGGRSRKSSSGYALTQLFCGAEGTLGVITEVTVRLAPRPASTLGAQASFPTVVAAIDFVTELIQGGAPVARCELLDSASARAIRQHLGLDLPETPTIFLEFHGDVASTSAAVDEALALAGEHGALAAVPARDPDTLAAIWRARHAVYHAMVASHPGMKDLVTDLAVPISKLAEVIEVAVAAVDRLDLPVYVLGHVGDGNFHLTFFYDSGDDDARRRAYDAHASLVEIVLEAGGTCTGEHGVGVRKLPYVRREHGAAVDLMWAIKDALDPNGIMNPGKKLPPR